MVKQKNSKLENDRTTRMVRQKDGQIERWSDSKIERQ